MKRSCAFVVTCLTMSVAALTAQAGVQTTVEVSAEDSVQFAGPVPPALLGPLPEVFKFIFPANALNYYHDAYDDDVFPTAVDITGFGNQLKITASGEWNTNRPGSVVSGPDGNGMTVTSNPLYSLFGVSQLTADLNTLVGVFTTDSGPTLLFPPAMLEAGVDDMHNPLLNQAFVIGSLLDGLNVPDGATTLWLGIHNQQGWNKGTGSMTVTVQAIPVPASVVVWGLIGVSGYGYGVWRRRQRRREESASASIAA